MSAPLPSADRERGLTALRGMEGSEWLFPPDWTWHQERARIARAEENLSLEFGRRCSFELLDTALEESYFSSPHCATIITRPRRSQGIPLVVVLCTFGIATAWPPRASPLDIFRRGGKRFALRAVWTPDWWDGAGEAIEHSLDRAARCVADAGYAYVPDPVFDEPYDGCLSESRPQHRWIGRYFEHIRDVGRVGYESERASRVVMGS